MMESTSALTKAIVYDQREEEEETDDRRPSSPSFVLPPVITTAAQEPAAEDDMETILEDLTSADYVMVPSSSLLPTSPTEQEDVFGSGRPPPPAFPTGEEAPSSLTALRDKRLWTNVLSPTWDYVSSFIPFRRNTIYQSYDWVSETVVDDQGGRLILPGQLIVLGDNHDSPNDDVVQRMLDRDETNESTTIMVSAHDLLSTQQQQNDAAGGSLGSSISSSATTSIPMKVYQIVKRQTIYRMTGWYRRTTAVVLPQSPPVALFRTVQDRVETVRRASHSSAQWMKEWVMERGILSSVTEEEEDQDLTSPNSQEQQQDDSVAESSRYDPATTTMDHLTDNQQTPRLTIELTTTTTSSSTTDTTTSTGTIDNASRIVPSSTDSPHQ